MIYLNHKELFGKNQYRIPNEPTLYSVKMKLLTSQYYTYGNVIIVQIKVSDMKVLVLRIISVFTLIIIIIGLFCQTKIWTPIKNQLLGDSQGKRDFKLQPTDETIMHWKIGGGSDSLKNLERDSNWGS